MLDNTSKWSHARGNTVVPSRWQATVTTEAALVIMGKAHDLLDVLTKRSRDDSEHTTR